MAKPAGAAFRNDFSDYPSGTVQCLNDASYSSRCTGDTSKDMNACLCSNRGGFLSDSAKCIAQQDLGDMASTWEILQLHCSTSNTPLSITLPHWMAVASDITTSKPTSPTSTSSAEVGDEKRCPLSSSAELGIIAGSLGAGLLLVTTALFFCFRHTRRRQKYDKVHHSQLASSSHSNISRAPTNLESSFALEILNPNFGDTRGRPVNVASAPSLPGAFHRTTPAHTSDLSQSHTIRVVYEMPATLSHGPSAPSLAPATAVEMPTAGLPSEASPTVQSSAPGQSSRDSKEPNSHRNVLNAGFG